jgi:hypothetical protein
MPKIFFLTASVLYILSATSAYADTWVWQDQDKEIGWKDKNPPPGLVCTPGLTPAHDLCNGQIPNLVAVCGSHRTACPHHEEACEYKSVDLNTEEDDPSERGHVWACQHRD